MKKIFMLLMLVAVLAVIVSPVLAKTGGIKVDDDANCEDVDKEDNALRPSCTSIIWLNLPKGDLGSYTCQICDSGVCSACTGGTSFSHCGGDSAYYRAFFTTPSGSGARTVVISDGEGNVSRDSFRLVADEPCD